MDRRAVLTGLCALPLMVACRPEGNLRPAGETPERLSLRQGEPRVAYPAGTHRLRLGDARDALFMVPAAADSKSLPLLVLLHGAGGAAANWINYQRRADALGCLMLAIDSRGPTWDAIHGEFGPDVRFLERALERVIASHAVDLNHLAVGGFSDGASYALGLGMANGDVFRAVIAFSPGMLPSAPRRGLPRLFISHGSRDDVLPVKTSREAFVPQFRRWGYATDFVEFDGGHEVPSVVASCALNWWLA